MKSLVKLLLPSGSSFCALALVAGLYLFTLYLLPRQGFWITDNANKFLQMRAIVDSNYSDYSIPWPGQTIDPDFTCNPLPKPFSQVQNHKLYSIFSPVFATISSFPYRLWGFEGLYILPLLASLLSLTGLIRLAQDMGMSILTRNVVVLITGLATPLWFYSVVFWEHTIAVCFAVWSVVFYINFLSKKLNRHLVLAAIFSALSVYFRDELYLFCLLLLGTTLIYTPEKRFKTLLLATFCLIVSLIPLWLFQAHNIGHPFGFHLGAHLTSAAGIIDHLSSRPKVFYHLFMAAHPRLWISLIITTPFLIASIINPKLIPRSFYLALPVYCLFVIACSLFVITGYFTSSNPINWTLKTNSLFATTPIIFLAFIRLKKNDAAQTGFSPEKLLWFLCLAYAIIYALAAPQLGSTGIHWANRFLLILYPFLALLAANNLTRWFAGAKSYFSWSTLAIVLTLLLSFTTQACSIHLLYHKKEYSHRLNLQIRNLPQKIVITDNWWIPQDLYSRFYDKSIFYTPDQQQLKRLLIKLRLNGHKKALFASQDSGASTEPLVAEVDDTNLKFFSIKFYSLDIESLTSETMLMPP
jgi:hypothetical protein